jgi:hypothetical protein
MAVLNTNVDEIKVAIKNRQSRETDNIPDEERSWNNVESGVKHHKPNGKEENWSVKVDHPVYSFFK